MYNGKTYEQVENNLPTNMHKVDKRIYLQNVKEFIKLGSSNQGYKECILNSNFNIIKPYIYARN